jgi:hypothetical protein
MSLYAKVEQHHRLTYSNSIQMVSQQMRSYLMGSVTEKAATGEAMAVANLVGQFDYVYLEDYSRQNPEGPAQRSRRWVVRPEAVAQGVYLDTADKFDMAMDPTGSVQQGLAMAMRRGWDDRLLGIRETAPSSGTLEVTYGGILGRATEGKQRNTVIDLPASQVLDAAASGLTLDKLRAAQLLLHKADFGLDDMDQMYCAITPQQADDLLEIAAKADASFTAFQIEQLRTGKPTTLMGMTWIRTNRLPKDAAGNRLCPVWTKRNIVAGVWQGITGDMWNNPNALNKPYAFATFTMDCVRVEDKGVVVIPCVEP